VVVLLAVPETDDVPEGVGVGDAEHTMAVVGTACISRVYAVVVSWPEYAMKLYPLAAGPGEGVAEAAVIMLIKVPNPCVSVRRIATVEVPITAGSSNRPAEKWHVCRAAVVVTGMVHVTVEPT
jgi:hypothetical protein